MGTPVKCTCHFPHEPRKELIDCRGRTYRTFIYSGQLDVIIGAPLTERFLNVLPWSASPNTRTQTVNLVRESQDQSSFCSKSQVLTEIIIRGAGLSPSDQPARARDKIDHLVSGEPPQLGKGDEMN